MLAKAFTEAKFLLHSVNELSQETTQLSPG